MTISKWQAAPTLFFSEPQSSPTMDVDPWLFQFPLDALSACV